LTLALTRKWNEGEWELTIVGHLVGIAFLLDASGSRREEELDQHPEDDGRKPPEEDEGEKGKACLLCVDGIHHLRGRNPGGAG
jgi:hypothetical protein